MIKKIKYKIRSFFGFSSSETNGLLVLIPILFLILYFPEGVKQLFLSTDSLDSTEDELLLKEWYEASKAKLQTEEVKEEIISPGFFNPNNISKEKWIALGFKDYVAENIIKYRRTGGKFRKKEDLLEIYYINKKLVLAYDKYIIIPPEPKKIKIDRIALKQAVREIVAKSETATFDLNQVDSADLVAVRGIGTFLSRTILEYRVKLGGFISNEQLSEVYGMKKENYERIKEKFVISENSITKIDINQDSVKPLLRHPYIDYKTSLAIVKYRSQHGDYQSIEELKKIHVITEDIYQKMAPYLMVSLPE